MANGYIYGVKFKTDGKVYYVGQTRGSVQRRWRQHLRGELAVSRALDLLGGEDAFEICVLECVPSNKLNEREIFWIEELDTLSPRGLNQRNGGQFSEAALTRMRASAIERTNDPEWRRKASVRQKARMASPEIRRELSEMAKQQMQDPGARKRSAEGARKQMQDPANKRAVSEATTAMLKSRWADPVYRERMKSVRTGYKHTQEALVNMSIAQMGHPVTTETRAKLSAAKRGVPLSDAHKTSVREAARRRTITPELSAKYREAGLKAAAKRWGPKSVGSVANGDHS